MKKLYGIKYSIIILFIIWVNPAKSAHNYLERCWKLQVMRLNSKHLTFKFKEKSNEFEHTFEPWQQTKYSTDGIVWLNINNFSKRDSIVSDNGSYSSKSIFTKKEFLLAYGNRNLYPVTQKMFLEQIIKTARYSPVRIIDYFHKNQIYVEKLEDKKYAIYKTNINNSIVKLYIRKSNKLLDIISVLNYDDFYGDVISTFSYNNYTNLDGLSCPNYIQISKINGKLIDEIILNSFEFVPKIPEILKIPENYSMSEEVEKKIEIRVEKFNNNINFIELLHKDDRVMVVEFKDFLLVAEAPSNSKNGELIISEARKIAPNKEIKYFVPGHYHPYYLGGFRPFVHKGAKIICSPNDENYIKYLAQTNHTLQPDSLELDPKQLQTEYITDKKTISDGKFEMIIFNIGAKSSHSKDYLIYYFPAEKLLFEDESIWISQKGEIKKANGRQLGLYNAIKDLNIEIQTIYQSWPLKNLGTKSVISFEELKQSVNIK